MGKAGIVLVTYTNPAKWSRMHPGAHAGRPDESYYQEMKTFFRAFHLRAPYASNWSSVGITQNTVAAYKAALAWYPKATTFYLVSGDSVPIKGPLTQEPAHTFTAARQCCTFEPGRCLRWRKRRPVNESCLPTTAINGEQCAQFSCTAFAYVNPQRGSTDTGTQSSTADLSGLSSSAQTWIR
jgi:hypothetical protein